MALGLQGQSLGLRDSEAVGLKMYCFGMKALRWRVLKLGKAAANFNTVRSDSGQGVNSIS